MQPSGKPSVKILFVDDEPLNAEIFEINFADQFDILTASSGGEALEIFHLHPEIGIIVSDHRMPGMSGVELLSRIYQMRPDTIRIIITAFAEIGNLLDAINRGHIYHYIVKPWDATQLAIVLEQGIKVWNLTAENKRLIIEQQEMNEKLQQLSLHLIHAQEDERRHISMELHDDIGQNLIALKLQFDNYCSQLRSKDLADAEETKAVFRQTLRRTVNSTRNLSEQLSPTVVEKFGLDQAMSGFINDFCRDYRLTFSCEGERIEQFLSKKDQHQIYRILQEVFNNIGKHSGTGHVAVATWVADSWLFIAIRDFGCGFDATTMAVPHPERSGRGLTTIQARATILGGSVEIGSTVKEGTTVTLKVPIERRTPA
jgi:signal transduction histidine kinase